MENSCSSMDVCPQEGLPRFFCSGLQKVSQETTVFAFVLQGVLRSFLLLFSFYNNWLWLFMVSADFIVCLYGLWRVIVFLGIYGGP